MHMDMDWLYSIMFFGCAALIVFALIPPVKALAFKIDAVDRPSKRRVHNKPTARLGGVAIITSICATCVIAGVGVKYMGWQIPLSYTNFEHVNYIIASVGVLFMFGTGIADDAKCLPPKVKFLLQIIAATIVAASGLLFYRIYNPFTASFIEFGWMAYPITILYLVAFANIINLIDGLDGLAAGISAIVATTIFIFSITSNKADAAILSLAIMGACSAFLVFNFHPAKIFMGDSGSLTLGLLLGMASLLATTRTAVIVSMLVPLLATGVPIVDTMFAIIRRKREHQPIDQADTGHIHHRLLRSGLTTRQTVLIMWGWTLLLSVCGIIMTVKQEPLIETVMLVVALGFTIFMVVKLRLFESVLKHHYNHRVKKNRHYRKTKYGIYNEKIEHRKPLTPDEVEEYLALRADRMDEARINEEAKKIREDI